MIPRSSRAERRSDFVFNFSPVSVLMVSSQRVLWRPGRLLPLISPSIRSFSSELDRITWPKYVSLSFVILPIYDICLFCCILYHDCIYWATADVLLVETSEGRCCTAGPRAALLRRFDCWPAIGKKGLEFPVCNAQVFQPPKI